MKTLTTYEALKANEAKRVRACGQHDWFEVRELIKWLNTTHREWEAEEPLIERWLIMSSSNEMLYNSNTKADAEATKKTFYPDGRIVHLREVRS